MIPLMDGLVRMTKCETDLPIRKSRMIQKRRPDTLFRRNVLTRKYFLLARLLYDVVE